MSQDNPYQTYTCPPDPPRKKRMPNRNIKFYQGDPLDVWVEKNKLEGFRADVQCHVDVYVPIDENEAGKMMSAKRVEQAKEDRETLTRFIMTPTPDG